MMRSRIQSLQRSNLRSKFLEANAYLSVISNLSFQTSCPSESHFSYSFKPGAVEVKTTCSLVIGSRSSLPLKTTTIP
ncbi:hypothetical protein V2G26_019308 [Clonostachys chloroleuca]